MRPDPAQRVGAEAEEVAAGVVVAGVPAVGAEDVPGRIRSAADTAGIMADGLCLR